MEVDDDDEAIGEDGDDGYNPNEMKIKSGVGKGVLDQVHTKLGDLFYMVYGFVHLQLLLQVLFNCVKLSDYLVSIIDASRG